MFFLSPFHTHAHEVSKSSPTHACQHAAMSSFGFLDLSFSTTSTWSKCSNRNSYKRHKRSKHKWALEREVYWRAEKLICDLQVDAELTRLEKLSEGDIERMRAQRIESMKQDHKKRQEWLTQGKNVFCLIAVLLLFWQCTRSRRISRSSQWKRTVRFDEEERPHRLSFLSRVNDALQDRR